jgi:RsiW-degrading membrane proteinase PrsW (M82 family)
VRRILWYVATIALALGGIGLLAGFALLLKSSSDAEVRTDASIVGGLGLVALIAAVLLVATRVGKRQTISSAAFWITGSSFATAIVAGWVTARSDRWPVLDVVLALVALTSAALFVAAIAMRWAPGKSAGKRLALGASAWGMVGATSVALILELVAAIALFAGGIMGLYLADPALVRSIREQGLEQIIDQSGPNLVTTTTVAIGIAAVYALLAPMSEEFAKLLGTMIFLPNSASRYDAFIGGVFAGLGFASVETLVYALAAGDRWPLLVAIRAPIALVHVAAAVVAALGWHATRDGGPWAIARGYGLAVLIHGAWNGLIVAVLLLTASVDESSQIAPASAIALTAIVGVMGLHLFGCFTLITVAARKLGREEGDRDVRTDERPPSGSGTYFERTSTLSSAPIASV